MKHCHFPLSLLMSGLLLTACVDKDYDLDNVDLTLGTNVDLAMPLISTTQIKLIDFVKGDFLGTTPIHGQEGEVLYAHAEMSQPGSIKVPVVMDGTITGWTPNIPDVNLPDLPDFLKGDNVHLDLENPIIIAFIENEDLPNSCTITAEATVTADNGKQFTINQLHATGGEKLCQYISAEEDNIPASVLGEDYSKPQHISPTSGSVRAMFSEKIPRKFSITITKLSVKGAGSTPIVKDHTINVKFKLYAPLQIGGTDFALSYETNEDGWSKEFSDDVRKMDIGQVELTATMTNGLPLDANVTLTPIDTDGNVINDLESIVIEKAEAGKAKEISYVMKSKKPGCTLRDFICGTHGAQQLDGMRINASLKAGNAAEGKYITDKAYATFTNLKLSAKGQFIYDAN